MRGSPEEPDPPLQAGSVASRGIDPVVVAVRASATFAPATDVAKIIARLMRWIVRKAVSLLRNRPTAMGDRISFRRR